MEEKKFVSFKKDEFRVREYIKNALGKGRISAVIIEYTPVGEKIKVSTSRPGLVIGRKGEKIDELTRVLKKRFKLDNPHIEIVEIMQPLLDAQLVADEIAIMLERKGSLKFKVIAYKMLQQIIKAGAQGTEITLAGKLPSDRARTWRFSHGYLKKTGEPAKLVDRAQSQATTIAGVVGVSVAILRPEVALSDQIKVDETLRQKIKMTVAELDTVKEEIKEIKETKPKKKTVKKSMPTKKSTEKTMEEKE
ncbi:30S ribosomal protein S3 [Candidatus Pacearchaeota archaeon]|uniref:30S ribosomal protein S3 n=1 Tax=uncultured organism TaxID=155900 RepID=U3GQR1_9ZZZZ|nr:30S ribosomal protein S3 [uncultured organism]AJS11828.1 small subunit ribosomal protein S3 [uncultured archaeon]MBS3077476.1 30S ribosomal protein S3 [Candidatus Pacearchaeota archaeon]